MSTWWKFNGIVLLVIVVLYSILQMLSPRQNDGATTQTPIPVQTPATTSPTATPAAVLGAETEVINLNEAGGSLQPIELSQLGLTLMLPPQWSVERETIRWISRADTSQAEFSCVFSEPTQQILSSEQTITLTAYDLPQVSRILPGAVESENVPEDVYILRDEEGAVRAVARCSLDMLELPGFQTILRSVRFTEHQ